MAIDDKLRAEKNEKWFDKSKFLKPVFDDRIETARRDEDRLLAAFGEIIQKIQEHTE